MEFSRDGTVSKSPHDSTISKNIKIAFSGIFLDLFRTIGGNCTITKGFPYHLPEPESYFSGITAATRPRADNLITFLRTSRATLQQRNFANRSHYRHVLLLILETAGSVIVDGTEHPLRPGQAFYVRPFQFHHYLNLADDSLRWLFLTFELERGSETMLALSDRVFTPADQDIEVWRSLVACANRPNSDDPSEALPRLDLLLHRLCRLVSPPRSRQPKTSWIAEAEGLILRSVEEGWSVEDIGRKLGLSGRHLRNRFEAEMGISIRDYRANYQLHRAISLMRNPKLPMGRVAELCGFHSQPVFNRFIKRMTDRTPKELRSVSLE